MQKKFLTNLGFLVLVNLLIKPFYILGIDAEVQNAVGAEDYGMYFAIFNFSFLFNIINDLGITNWNNRNIAQHRQLLEKHFPRILGLRMMLLVLYLVITIAVGLLVGYNSMQVKMLAFLTFNAGLVATIFYLRSNLSGLHLFKQDSIISVLDRSLLIVFCGILLWTNVGGETFKIEWFVYAQTISYAITVLIALLLVRRNLSSIRLRWDPVFWISIIRQSAPFALLILVMSLYHRMDTVILERMVDEGDVQSGIYAQGFRFLDALNNFSFLFAVLLFPIFSRQLKEKESVKPLLDMASGLLLSGVSIIVLTCFAFRFEIIDWRYDDHVVMAGRCFGILILTAICHSTVHIYGTLLTAAGKLKALNMMGAIAVIVALGLHLWAAPRYLALGSAAANLCINSLVAIVHVLIVQRLFGFSIKAKVLGKLVFLILLMLVAGYYAPILTLAWPLVALLMLLFGLTAAMLLRLIDIRGLLGILKES